MGTSVEECRIRECEVCHRGYADFLTGKDPDTGTIYCFFCEENGELDRFLEQQN